MKNLFLDTNVIIDTLADRKPFSKAGANLFEYAEKGKINLFISSLTYANIYHIIRKSCTHKELISTLRDLESIIETVDVTKQIISKSLQSEFKDFEIICFVTSTVSIIDSRSLRVDINFLCVHDLRIM
ncbi:MAG: type II toxin-antitoxin system VapC family toxin [Flavobacteriales bacterium]